MEKAGRSIGGLDKGRRRARSCYWLLLPSGGEKEADRLLPVVDHGTNFSNAFLFTFRASRVGEANTHSVRGHRLGGWRMDAFCPQGGHTGNLAGEKVTIVSLDGSVIPVADVTALFPKSRPEPISHPKSPRRMPSPYCRWRTDPCAQR
jgi:hypothetical protein